METQSSARIGLGSADVRTYVLDAQEGIEACTAFTFDRYGETAFVSSWANLDRAGATCVEL
jgi:hypothetical protein